MTPHMPLAWGKQKSLLAEGSHQAALSCDKKYEVLVGPRGGPDVRQRVYAARSAPNGPGREGSG